MARQTDQNMDHRTRQNAAAIVGHQKSESAAPAHTLTPWRYDEFLACLIEGGNGAPIRGPANAAFILKAVNNHDALVNALQMFVAWSDGTHEGSPAGWHDAAMNAARDALSRVTAAK